MPRRYSTGTLSTTKPHSNASLKSSGLSKTGNMFNLFSQLLVSLHCRLYFYFSFHLPGVQRKLQMDRQAPQKIKKPTESNNKLTTNRVPARNSPGKFP